METSPFFYSKSTISRLKVRRIYLWLLKLKKFIEKILLKKTSDGICYPRYFPPIAGGK